MLPVLCRAVEFRHACAGWQQDALVEQESRRCAAYSDERCSFDLVVFNSENLAAIDSDRCHLGEFKPNEPRHILIVDDEFYLVECIDCRYRLGSSTNASEIHLCA